LLQQWHGLSDPALEAAVDDRLSFRRFCGSPLDRSVPDHASIWRFRQKLAQQGADGVTLGERLLAEVNAQRDARGLILRRGTLIDASIVKSAARPPAGDAAEVSARDPDAGFTKKNGKTSFGYKAHIATDEGSDLIRRAVMTTAQLHDGQACDVLIQGDEAAVFADPPRPAGRVPSRDRIEGQEAFDGLRRHQAPRAIESAGNRATHPLQGPAQQTAEDVAEVFQQGRRRRPGGGRTAARPDEGALPPRPLPLPRPGPQRHASATLRLGLQSQDRQGAGPMRRSRGRDVPEQRKMRRNGMT
jgi:IS5 family transposase